MDRVLSVVIAVPIAWLVTLGVRWAARRTSDQPVRWNESGGLALMGGAMVGVAIGELSVGERFLWPGVLLGIGPGLFLGALPSFREHRGVFVFSAFCFVIAIAFGAFLAAIFGLF